MRPEQLPWSKLCAKNPRMQPSLTVVVEEVVVRRRLQGSRTACWQESLPVSSCATGRQINEGHMYYKGTPKHEPSTCAQDAA